MPKTHILNPADNPVARMFWGKFPFTLATALLVFDKGNKTQKLIHQIKYYGHKELAVKMGKMLGAYLQNFDLFRSIDFLIPVPLHKRKLRMRGFNQSERIARGVSDISKKPVFTNVLDRCHYNPSQTRKSRYERWENVADIFRIKEGVQLQGKHILLVDDVITTGATMEACAHALLKIPEIKIALVSLASA
ncbi:MAG: ComF family protein [Chlorobi bacterium]|nr:ComF family protein [Chlorobiota bacterium]